MKVHAHVYRREQDAMEMGDGRGLARDVWHDEERSSVGGVGTDAHLVLEVLEAIFGRHGAVSVLVV